VNSRICALADLGEFLALIVTDRGHPAEIDTRLVTSFHPGPRSPAMGEGTHASVRPPSSPGPRQRHRRHAVTVTGIANSSLRASMTSLAPPHSMTRTNVDDVAPKVS
jgi:hypothetical protein